MQEEAQKQLDEIKRKREKEKEKKEKKERRKKAKESRIKQVCFSVVLIVTHCYCLLVKQALWLSAVLMEQISAGN